MELLFGADRFGGNADNAINIRVITWQSVTPSVHNVVSIENKGSTQAQDAFGDLSKFKVVGHWNPDSYDPDKWLAAASKAGFGYAVFDARHHDGYCLWPS